MTQIGKKTVKFCGKCASLSIKPIYSMETIDNRVECQDCKTIEFPIEASEKAREDFLAELNEKQRNKKSKPEKKKK